MGAILCPPGAHAGPSGNPAPCLHYVLGIPELAFEKVCLGVVIACWETAAAASDTPSPHLGGFVVVLKGTIGTAQAPASWCLHPKTDDKAWGCPRTAYPVPSPQNTDPFLLLPLSGGFVLSGITGRGKGIMSYAGCVYIL